MLKAKEIADNTAKRAPSMSHLSLKRDFPLLGPYMDTANAHHYWGLARNCSIIGTDSVEWGHWCPYVLIDRSDYGRHNPGATDA